MKLKLGAASRDLEPKETRVSAWEPQVALKEDACMDASGDEASMMTVCVRQEVILSDVKRLDDVW